MKKFILGVLLAAVAIPAAPALADPPYRGGYDDRGDRHDRGDRYERRDDWHGRGNGGYNFRRDDRRLGRNDRVWRDNDGRYRCRRSNGTTGLIVGALAGGALGNVIDGGRNRTLGTLLGAGGGALLGQSVDSGNVRCR